MGQYRADWGERGERGLGWHTGLRHGGSDVQSGLVSWENGSASTQAGGNNVIGLLSELSSEFAVTDHAAIQKLQGSSCVGGGREIDVSEAPRP